MKYNAPYGAPGANDPYINGNPATGTMGSIPPAASIEFPQREIVALITDSGLTPDNADLSQLAKAVQSQRVNYNPDTGTADALAVTLSPVPIAYSPGFTVTVKKGSASNATTTPTMNVNALGPRTITFPSGAPLRAGDLPAGTILTLVFDPITGCFVLVSLNLASLLITIATTGVTTVIYSSGSGNFVVPANVFVLREVELVGGGGGGGGSDNAANKSGGGGNGGSVVRGSLAVTPGQTIAWAVGAGGSAGTSASDGGGGTNTTFGTWLASFGHGGQTNGNAGTASGASNGGTEIYSGGQGSTGMKWPTDAIYVGGVGASNVAGGVGGGGAVNGGTNGNPGLAPGGAGGGGTIGTNGGPGAAGRILLRF